MKKFIVFEKSNKRQKEEYIQNVIFPNTNEDEDFDILVVEDGTVPSVGAFETFCSRWEKACAIADRKFNKISRVRGIIGGKPTELIHAIIDNINDADTLYIDIDGASKELSMILMMAFKYAFMLKPNTTIAEILSGGMNLKSFVTLDLIIDGLSSKIKDSEKLLDMIINLKI